MLRLTKAPFLLKEEILALTAKERIRPIIIDEIQKVPALLNEIHGLIENESIQFILCGSSALDILLVSLGRGGCQKRMLMFISQMKFETKV